MIPTVIQVLGLHIAWPIGEAFQTTIRENFQCSKILNALGALDCIHVRILTPINDIKYDYFKRKAYYSIVMQAIVDSSAKFIDVHICEPSSMNDSRILYIFPLYDPGNHGTLQRGLSIRLPS